MVSVRQSLIWHINNKRVQVQIEFIRYASTCYVLDTWIPAGYLLSLTSLEVETLIATTRQSIEKGDR